MNPSTPTSPARNRLAGRAAATLLASVAAAGCATETNDVRPTLPSVTKVAAAGSDRAPPSNASNLDPCAMRLHDVAGALFLYYFTYQRLPANVDEVNTFPGAEGPVPLACPVSGKPYVYTPDGILLPEQNARVIVYDATPAHYGGYRWAIRMEDPRDDKPMVARVIAVPERFFKFLPPAR